MSVPTNVSKQHPHLYRLAIDMASRAEAAGLQAGLSEGLLELLKSEERAKPCVTEPRARFPCVSCVRSAA